MKEEGPGNEAHLPITKDSENSVSRNLDKVPLPSLKSLY